MSRTLPGRVVPDSRRPVADERLIAKSCRSCPVRNACPRCRGDRVRAGQAPEFRLALTRPLRRRWHLLLAIGTGSIRPGRQTVLATPDSAARESERSLLRKEAARHGPDRISSLDRRGRTPRRSEACHCKPAWWEAKGDWKRAHACAQEDHTPNGAIVHAYLHRVEGDLSNAAGWYSRAGRPPSTAPLAEEWAALASAFL